MQKQISVVLGSYNRFKFLKKTIQSILENQANLDIEIIVIDGGSTDGSAEWLLKQKNIITIVQHNRGTFNGQPIERRSWGYFMNLGFKCAQGKYILMISDDCLLVPGAIRNGYDYFEQMLNDGRNIGALAFYFREWPDQKDYHVELTFGGIIYVSHGMYLRNALESVGWIDEDNFSFYCADPDLCLRLWAEGYEILDSPNSFVEHSTHAGLFLRRSNLQSWRHDQLTLVTKWCAVFNQKPDDQVGGWLKKSYEDPNKTVRNFPKFVVVIRTIELVLRKFKRCFERLFKDG
jgi:glycosyltransferase involved in cell wall biosynthesis